MSPPPTILPRQQIMDELAAMNIVPDPDWVPNVAGLVVNDDWFRNTFMPDWRHWLQVNGFDKFEPSSRMCKEFSFMFVARLRLAIWEVQQNAGADWGETLGGLFLTPQEHDWGGIPAIVPGAGVYGSHCLCVVKTNVAWLAVEPQTDTIDNFSKYPNAVNFNSCRF